MSKETSKVIAGTWDRVKMYELTGYNDSRLLERALDGFLRWIDEKGDRYTSTMACWEAYWETCTRHLTASAQVLSQADLENYTTFFREEVEPKHHITLDLVFNITQYFSGGRYVGSAFSVRHEGQLAWLLVNDEWEYQLYTVYEQYTAAAHDLGGRVVEYKVFGMSGLMHVVNSGTMHK